MSAVVIAAPELIPALRDRLPEQPVILTFNDSEPIQALQAILERRPQLIVLERLFAATPRGAALINRIKNDPELAECEIRVMAHTGDYARQVARPAAQPAAVGVADPHGKSTAASQQPHSTTTAQESPRPLDWHGTRRAPRHAVRPGVEIQLDGNAASVIDISTLGAQVISSTILRPNQKVRVSIPQDEKVVRCRGAVAWAKFELPNPAAPPVYRAGVEFLDADPDALDPFIARNVLVDPRAASPRRS